MKMFKHALVFFGLAVSVCAFSAEPVGTWNGKIQVDTSKLAADKRAQVEAQTGKLKIVLTLKKDHTFTSVVSGGGDGKPHSTSGTWTFKGNTVSMIATKNDGKAAAGAIPRSMVLSKDGKSLVMTVQSQMPKGQQQNPNLPPPPTVRVVFKKTG
jgi:hypothetical protein